MYKIGVDLGGTNIAAGIVDDEGKILIKDSVKTNAERDAAEIVRDMALLAKKLAADLGVSEDEIDWVGVGSPGTPDIENGILVYTNNLPFAHTPIRTLFQAVFAKPLYLDNDANCAAIGEAFCGAAKGAQNAVMLTLGTGVGGGIIVNGKIYSGFNYAGGEIGHTVVAMNGRPCTCGRRGCLEMYASVTGLIQTASEIAERDPASALHAAFRGEGLNGRNVFEICKAGDAAAQEAVETYFTHVGEGVLNMINVFQPEILLIGGGISAEGDYLLEPIRAFVDKGGYSKVAKTKILKAALGNDAGIIGAAMCKLYQ